jgi:hypothetical protein
VRGSHNPRWWDIQDVTKVSDPLLSPHQPLFMVIDVYHARNDDYISETLIDEINGSDFIKFTEYVIDDRWKGGIRIPHSTFRDEELRLKRDPSRTRDHTRS